MQRHLTWFSLATLWLLSATATLHAQVIEDSPPTAEVTTEPPAPEAVAPEAPASVESDKPSLVLSGSFFTRYELRHAYEKLGRVGPRFGELDAFFYRARLGLATTPIDVGQGRAVTMSIAPQASGFWGPSGGLADAGVGLHEAKLRIAGAKNWLDLGRFEMVYGDHLVIGNVGWHQTARSFDGARGRIAIGDAGAWVDGFVTLIGEGATDGTMTGFAQGDAYFAGVYAGLGSFVGEKMDLDAYVLANIVPESPAGQDFTAAELTLGSRVKKDMGSLAVRAEAGVQLGRRPTANVSVFAFQFDADVAIKASDGLKFIVGGLFASGDDPDTETNEAWSQLYPTAHKFLGFMDVIGDRSNVMSGFAKARFQATDTLGLAADLHVFLRPQTADMVDGYTGLETDAWASYQLGKGLDLRAQYAIFMPNETGPYGVNDLVHYLEIQLAYELK